MFYEMKLYYAIMTDQGDPGHVVYRERGVIDIGTALRPNVDSPIGCPATPGSYESSAPTWAPAGDSWSGRRCIINNSNQVQRHFSSCCIVISKSCLCLKYLELPTEV